MIMSKVNEMFAEAIPAGVLQMYAFVIAPKRSIAAAGSIMISALTTGFGAALISYGELITICGGVSVYVTKPDISNSPFPLSIIDFDTSPKKRRETPDFYGYVPSTGRGVIFALMMVNSTSQFLAKIMAMALLGAVSKMWAFAYLVGDMCLYLLYTLLRNDVFYGVPMQSYAGSIAYGLATRIVVKVRLSWKDWEICILPLPPSPNGTRTKTIGRLRLYGCVTREKPS